MGARWLVLVTASTPLATASLKSQMKACSMTRATTRSSGW